MAESLSLIKLSHYPTTVSPLGEVIMFWTAHSESDVVPAQLTLFSRKLRLEALEPCCLVGFSTLEPAPAASGAEPAEHELYHSRMADWNWLALSNLTQTKQ